MFSTLSETLDDKIETVFFEIFQHSLQERNTKRFSASADYEQKKELLLAYKDFFVDFADWKLFVTLTFRDPTGGEVALARWRALVQYLNVRLFGSHYTRVVHHSYFSYLLGVEFQRRDVIHFHVLMDRPVDLAFLHSLWNNMAGFAWAEKIETREQVVGYVCKYVLKGGDLHAYRWKVRKVPFKKPIWWSE